MKMRCEQAEKRTKKSWKIRNLPLSFGSELHTAFQLSLRSRNKKKIVSFEFKIRGMTIGHCLLVHLNFPLFGYLLLVLSFFC